MNRSSIAWMSAGNFKQLLQEYPKFLLKVVIGSIRLLSLPQDEYQVEGAKI
jgi:hypothetical protein